MDIKKIFDTLGLNGVWWQWKIRLWIQKLQHQKEALHQQYQNITYSHKQCSQCSAIMDRASGVCPKCGHETTHWRLQVGKRFLYKFFPEGSFVSSLILMAIFANTMVVISVFGLDHFFSPSPKSLIQMGALVPIRVISLGEYGRVLTYGYLHIGLWHLVFNTLALMQVGPHLEKEIGSARFFSVYTLCLLGGAFMDLAIRPHSLLVIAGASGALFGLIGFGITYCHFYGRALHGERNFFFRWALYSFIFGFFVGADQLAHLGGWITGACLGFLIEREKVRRWRMGKLYVFVALFCFLITLVSFTNKTPI